MCCHHTECQTSPPCSKKCGVLASYFTVDSSVFHSMSTATASRSTATCVSGTRPLVFNACLMDPTETKDSIRSEHNISDVDKNSVVTTACVHWAFITLWLMFGISREPEKKSLEVPDSVATWATRLVAVTGHQVCFFSLIREKMAAANAETRSADVAHVHTGNNLCPNISLGIYCVGSDLSSWCVYMKHF